MLRRLGAGTASLYDTNGNLTNLWSGTVGGVTNVYQYDALNRLTSVQADGSSAASYGFDAVGNLQSGAFGNGVTNLYQYDRLNRLTNAVWNLGSSARASFYYKLGLTGNRTNLIETVDTTSRTNAWQYDALYRLTNEYLTGIGNVGYAMDAVGNRTNRTTAGTVDQTPAYNTNDWLTTDAYETYLCFKPNLNYSIPITIGRVDWGWNGRAQYRNDWWYLTRKGTNGPILYEDDSFPVWPNVYINKN